MWHLYFHEHTSLPVRAERAVFFRIAVQFIQPVDQVFIAFNTESPALAQEFSCLTEFFKIRAKNYRNTKGCCFQNIMYPFSKATPDIGYSVHSGISEESMPMLSMMSTCFSVYSGLHYLGKQNIIVCNAGCQAG